MVRVRVGVGKKRCFVMVRTIQVRKSPFAMITSFFALFPGPKPSKATAFTLLELLVVISIIAVLAGILLPVTGSVMENARKTEAKSTEMQILTAVKSFQTDYGVYPLPAGTNTATDTTFDAESGNNAALFAILRNTDTSATPPNSRHTVYFEGKDVKNPDKPKSGFATKAGSTTIKSGSSTKTFATQIGTLVDPWGAGYSIRYDTGYTDAVVHPYSDAGTSANDTAGATTGILRFGVIAYSYGKDGQAGNAGDTGTAPAYTYGDDVVSWQ